METEVKLYEELESSSCFGLAYDSTTKECKKCDLARECDSKSSVNPLRDQLNVLRSETQQALDEAAAKKAARNSSGKQRRERPEGMPNPKELSDDEIKALIEERGGTWTKYDDPKVNRMRLVMSLEETYK